LALDDTMSSSLHKEQHLQFSEIYARFSIGTECIEHWISKEHWAQSVMGRDTFRFGGALTNWPNMLKYWGRDAPQSAHLWAQWRRSRRCTWMTCKPIKSAPFHQHCLSFAGHIGFTVSPKLCWNFCKLNLLRPTLHFCKHVFFIRKKFIRKWGSNVQNPKTIVRKSGGSISSI